MHLQIGDKTGQAAAQMNLSDIRKVLGLPPTTNDTSESADDAKSRTRRKSMENMDLLKVVLLPLVVSFPPHGMGSWLWFQFVFFPFDRNLHKYRLL